MSHPRSRKGPGRWLAVGLLLGLVAGCEPRNAFVAPPPPEVTVSPPLRRSVRNSIEYTGTTKPIEAVDLRARVKGFLEKVHFKSGEEVKEGELLFEIDPKSYQAQVDKAAAELARDEAQLASAESEFRRSTQLYQRKVISDEEFIKARATRDSDKAAVDAARAALTEAKLNLGYTRITAPIDGRISRNLVDPGNLVGDGTATLLATIVKDDPIYAYMTVSEKDLLRFRQQVREGKRVDYRKVPIPLDLAMASESGFPHVGRLDYADPSVDPDTGTVVARGVFPNPDHAIVPGLFVRIRVPLEQRDNALLVPDRAIGVDQAGKYVLIVNSKQIVERVPIKVGALIDGMRVIEEGLKPDDLVVIDGLQKTRPGAKVNPKRVEPTAKTPEAPVEVTRPAKRPEPAVGKTAQPSGRSSEPNR